MEECWESWRMALSPKWHGHTWLLAWRLALELRMLELRDWLGRHGGLEGAHGFGGVLELWRFVDEELWRIVEEC